MNQPTSTVTVRPVRPDSADDLENYVAIQLASWDPVAWPMTPDQAAEQARGRFTACPEGLLLAFKDGHRAVGTTTQIRVNYDFDHPQTWAEVTANGTCASHDPAGEYWFGVDFSAKGHPDVAEHLFAAAADIVVATNARGLLWGSRMPGYSRFLARSHSRQLSPDEYLNRYSNGRYGDPQVQMYAEEFPGTKVVTIVPNYYPDPESLNYGVLMRWLNPDYRPPC